jgi:hypothetical protein
VLLKPPQLNAEDPEFYCLPESRLFSTWSQYYLSVLHKKYPYIVSRGRHQLDLEVSAIWPSHQVPSSPPIQDARHDEECRL